MTDSESNIQTDNRMQLTRFDSVIKQLQRGQPVIMIDAADRENEGDLIIPTECITAELVALMMREARGLICVTISQERAGQLALPAQTLINNSPYSTPFTVSVDLATVSSYGVTASARAATMKALLDPESQAKDFISPGHVFPLVANPSGVFGRQGQTEGSYDIAQIAGFKPSSVICEILNPDGTMARGSKLEQFAARLSLPITSVQAVMEYRLRKEVRVREVAQRELETAHGRFNVRVYFDDATGKEHLALSLGLSDSEVFKCQNEAPLVRIHSECLTGDVFMSRRCDCGSQLDTALKLISEARCGAVLYLRQEGRGIGLSNKIKAYALQDCGRDTVEANEELGFPADMRDFLVAAKILELMAIKQVRLLTNNPNKVMALDSSTIKVIERVPLIAKQDSYSLSYLKTKQEKLGHLLGI